MWTLGVCMHLFFPTCCPLETLEVIANKNIVMLCKDLLHTRMNEIVTKVSFLFFVLVSTVQSINFIVSNCIFYRII